MPAGAWPGRFWPDAFRSRFEAALERGDALGMFHAGRLIALEIEAGRMTPPRRVALLEALRYTASILPAMQDQQVLDEARRLRELLERK